MRLRKAVVLAAGWGTRFLPATKAQPKEMLPLVDKPIIQYVVEELVQSGIEQIVIVTALGKRALEDHFDRSFELEAALEKKGDDRLLGLVRGISDLARIYYVRQKEQLGVGHAVLTTEDIVGNEPFALCFPDDVIAAAVPAMAQMMDVYDRYRCSVLAVEEVPRSEVHKYGIIEGHSVDERVYQVRNLVEKPDPSEAPSNLGIVGRYILTPEIFDAIRSTQPGKLGEIQITDALRILLERQAIYAFQFDGARYDTGSPLGFLKASVEMALRRPDIGPEFRAYLEGVDLAGGRREDAKSRHTKDILVEANP
ncbi:MAG: UTP--glucose-1-phosphate uridylyltransferase GalU [Dehalococcoidia bacterium]